MLRRGAGCHRDVREGQIIGFDDRKSTAAIALSQKHSVSVDINKNERVAAGDKIDVVVTKARGHLSADASSKTAQLERLRQELIKEIQDPHTAYNGTVKEIVNNSANVFNGFIVDIKGVRCFMPGTESDVVPLNDFNDLLGRDLYVMPINQIKDSIIVSHKEYLNTLKPSVLKRLMELPKGSVITGLDRVEGSAVFHAGTRLADNKQVLTNGGRVLCVTSLAESMPAALLKSYQEVEKIQWDGCYYRHDIGQDLLKLMI